MKRLFAIPVLALTLLSFSAPAMAGDFDQPGFYVVLGGFNGFEQFQRDNQFEVDAQYGNTLGFQARIGMRVLPFLAGEIQGDFIGGFPVTVPTEDFGLVPLELNGGLITGNIRAIWPLGRFEPHAKVGVGGMWSNLVTVFPTGRVCSPGYWGWWCSPTHTRLASGGAFVARFGGGLDVWITEDFALALDAEYVLPTGELEAQQYVSFGWAAKFKF
jgi:hypothetical protein